MATVRKPAFTARSSGLSGDLAEFAGALFRLAGVDKPPATLQWQPINPPLLDRASVEVNPT